MCNNKFLLVMVDQVYNFDITFQLMAQQRDRRPAASRLARHVCISAARREQNGVAAEQDGVVPETHRIITVKCE